MEGNQTSELNQQLASPEAGLKEHFTTVTPLSKFLAMALFVALPFIGFWFGLNFQKQPEAKVKPPVVSDQTELTSNNPSVEKTIQTEKAIDKTVDPIKNYILNLPTQEDIYTEEQGKYRITIPEGLVYTIYPSIQENSFGTLLLWTSEDWQQLKEEVTNDDHMEGEIGFSIEFIPDENLKSYSFPTKEEFVRKVSGVSVYKPVATLAGHEEAWIDMPGGKLHLVNKILNAQSISWFDKIIKNIDIPSSEEGIIWHDEVNEYTSHDGYIYLNGKKIEGADAQSFQIVTENPFPEGIYNGDGIMNYSKDKSHVYYDGKIISGALSSSFKVVYADAIVVEQIYAQDEKNVYYRGLVLTPKADPGSFVPLNAFSNSWRVEGPYSHDNNRIYYKNKEVIGADLLTFETEYEDGYASDKNHVFLEGKIVPNINPKDFSFPVHEP